ncbi:MAG TPA: DinB family protein [Pyrinomonadaceae bacterium]|jgi:hypothetical protein|nr:DinB family protein [Pyrinomonadaceae bacterium]
MEQDERAATDQDGALREHLLYLLRGGGAHIDFEKAVADFPVKQMNRRVEHLPYSAWQVLEHMRIAQWDILEFSRNPAHVSPAWPDGYWRAKDVVLDANAWDKSVEAFRADLKAFTDYVADPANDLFTPFPHGEGQTLLREALLVADHNAYHLGVLVTLRRMLEASDDSQS